jgi:hypothetical protein
MGGRDPPYETLPAVFPPKKDCQLGEHGSSGEMVDALVSLKSRAYDCLILCATQEGNPFGGSFSGCSSLPKMAPYLGDLPRF